MPTQAENGDEDVRFLYRLQKNLLVFLPTYWRAHFGRIKTKSTNSGPLTFLIISCVPYLLLWPSHKGGLTDWWLGVCGTMPGMDILKGLGDWTKIVITTIPLLILSGLLAVALRVSLLRADVTMQQVLRHVNFGFGSVMFSVGFWDRGLGGWSAQNNLGIQNVFWGIALFSAGAVMFRGLRFIRCYRASIWTTISSATVCGVVFIIMVVLCSTLMSEVFRNRSNVASTQIDYFNAAQAADLIAQNPNLQIVDVRTSKDFASGHIEHARNIDFLSNGYDKLFGELQRQHPVLLYGSATNSYAISFMASVREMGFDRFVHLQGGVEAWSKQGRQLRK